jgi:hypothetical protein
MSTATMPTTTDRDEALAQRVIDLLASEGKPMHTGEIAALLGVYTHQVQTAMHHPCLTGRARFFSSEGYSVPPAPEKLRDDKQERLA